MRGWAGDSGEMRAYLLHRWRRLLMTLALLPVGVYLIARGDNPENVPLMLALFVGWELFVLWSFRRRRLFWFGRRY